MDAPMDGAAEPRRGGGDRRGAGPGVAADVLPSGDSERVLKVGAGTSARRLAGAVAGAVRDGRSVALAPIGAACINQAIKGVAAARKLLADEGIDVTCAPTFRDALRKSVVLKLTAVKHSPEAAPPEEVTLTVASASMSGLVAGAIAAKVREELPVCLKACGAIAVAQAVYALATARHYLAKDGVDIVCQPEMLEETLGGADAGGGDSHGGEAKEPRTVLKLTVAVSAVGAVPLTLDGSAAAAEGDAATEGAGRGGGGGDGEPPARPYGVRGGGRRPRAAEGDGAAAAEGGAAARGGGRGGGGGGGGGGGRRGGGGRGAPAVAAPAAAGAAGAGEAPAGAGAAAAAAAGGEDGQPAAAGGGRARGGGRPRRPRAPAAGAAEAAAVGAGGGDAAAAAPVRRGGRAPKAAAAPDAAAA